MDALHKVIDSSALVKYNFQNMTVLMIKNKIQISNLTFIHCTVAVLKEKTLCETAGLLGRLSFRLTGAVCIDHHVLVKE